MRLPINDTLGIDDSEIEISFITAGGPGGQNVNKLSSAAQLRFDARRSVNLPNAVSVRLQELAGSRLTKDGVIVITARAQRTQERNKAEVIERLMALIREAALPPPPKRRATKPSYSARKERVESKVKRGSVKKLRGRPDAE
jgi:ribosome-associated protein